MFVPCLNCLLKINHVLCYLKIPHVIIHHGRSFFFFFFFINNNSLKSAEGRNPNTHEVYKRAPNQGKETNKNVKNQQTTYYPGYALTPKYITY
jgi:hypothetical protein